MIARGSRATVYEAMQLNLDRRVAFKLLHDRALADRVRRLRWPEHPGAVRLFGAGDSELGPWVAMGLVPGGSTLETQAAPLDQVGAALDAAHAAGIVHGGVKASNVLVAGGRGVLSDFGLEPREGSVMEDREALQRLRREHPPPAPTRRCGVVWLAAGTAALGLAGLGVVLVGGGERRDDALPPRPAGTRAAGSDLAPGRAESVDCRGRRPSGESEACTVSQRTLGGRPVVSPTDGTVTSWAVRGARGTLALQVLRGRGRGFIDVARSADATIPGPAAYLVQTDLPVAAGDRVGLVVGPDAVIGVRRGRATIERWFGPLRSPARAPERPVGTGLDRELLLRVDIRPGPPRGSSPGRVLASRAIDAAGRARRVVVVSTRGGVFVDLFDGRRRIGRTPVAGADRRGRLRELVVGTSMVRVLWRNRGGEPVDWNLGVRPDGFR